MVDVFKHRFQKLSNNIDKVNNVALPIMATTSFLVPQSAPVLVPTAATMKAAAEVARLLKTTNI
jgi:hypothetical protein